MAQSGASAARATDAIWQEYRRTACLDLRNRLVVQYSPLVKFVALRARSGLPRWVDADDLVSCGMFGLIDAIERFDPERGVKFEAYAATRIRGAIADELRAADWVPRSVRSKSRSLEGASDALRHELGRDPDASELAHAVGLTRREVDRVQAQIRSGNILSLEQPVGPDKDGSRTLRDRVLDHASDPDASDRSEEVKELVATATEGIDRRARDILRMSYEERRTLADIGRALGVTESRVCQIRTQVLRAARERVHRQMRVDDVGLPSASSVAVQV